MTLPAGCERRHPEIVQPVSDDDEDHTMTAVTDAPVADAGLIRERTLRQVRPGRLFIDGAWTTAADNRAREVIDPTTGAVITTVAEAGPEDVRRAVAAARAAFDGGGWSGRTPRERARVLARAADLLREQADHLARLESLDVGKPLLFTRTVDVPTAIDTCEYFAALAASLEGAVRPTAIPALAYTRREPLGVVAAITPFNFPLILSVTKIAAALVAGNTIVHKPAEETPLSALRLAAVLQEAGVPAGVYNLLTGGGDVGAGLVADERVDKVAFTGSTEVGRLVNATAARSFTQVTVELGGKGANIVFADADLEAAIHTAISGVVFNTGQFCMAGTRLLVQRPVYDDVLAALAAALPQVPVGDPFAEGTIVGPMAGARHLAKVTSFVNAATKDTLRILGTRDALPEGGFFTAPLAIAGAAQDSTYVQEEIFGPVVTVSPFDTEDDAVALANGTRYGLAAGLQTTSMSRAHRVAARLRAGIVWVNGWGLLDPAMPFGGTGQSGFGRENGPEGLAEYLRTKSVVVALGAEAGR
jgi:acyl-CoA reductase-like NAD-dependent aldehyde dehydrogenase